MQTNAPRAGRRSVPAALTLALLAASCAHAPDSGPEPAAPAPEREAWPTRASVSPLPDVGTTGGLEEEGLMLEGPAGPRRPTGASLTPRIRRGTGELIATPLGEVSAPEQARGAGDITVNFENTDLREVVKLILGDILKVNYLIAEGVSGSVTLRSQQPLARDDLLPVLETVLQLNGAGLVPTPQGYEIIPLGEGAAGAGAKRVGRVVGLGAGFGTQVVQVRYVAAEEIANLLQALVPQGASVKAAPQRNLLILSGPRRAVASLIEAVGVFDVNWLKGMSLGVYPLQYSDAKIVTDELQEVLASEEGPSLKGVVRLIPVERLNAVLVISKQPAYLDDVAQMIQQLDRGTEAPIAGRRLYVYPLQNGKASYLASLLQEVFLGGEATTARAGAAGGLGIRERLGTGGAGTGGAGDLTDQALTTAARRVAGGGLGLGAAREGEGGTLPVSITADTDNNALLVMASPQDYRTVEAAIRRLDVRPRQVLIETIIAEVTLSGQLEYGVQWYLNGRLGQYDSVTNFQSGIGEGGLPSIPMALGGPGVFSYSLATSEGVKFLFDLLATESEVRFLSVPQVLVVDNQTANIRVGDQIPVTVRSSNAVAGDTIVSETQYRDTGTILRVTPRINAGGLVTMEVSQEVSVPGDAPAGTNPPILQRTVESTVVVQSGDAIALGGLIRETTTTGSEGLPVLKDLPVIGALFGSKGKARDRTELIVTITPTVIEDQYKALEATQELRQRMSAAAGVADEAYRKVRVRAPTSAATAPY
jgi:general secretion pathway protein D